MTSFTYAFRARIKALDFGRMTFAVVDVPARIAKELPLTDYPRLRIRGAVNDVPHKAAIQPKGKGKYFLMISKRLMKACQVAVGDRVSVGFEIDDQDAVDVPVELANALERDEVAARIWQALTPGKQRSFCCMVDNAKRATTRERRAQDAVEMLHDLE